MLMMNLETRNYLKDLFRKKTYSNNKGSLRKYNRKRGSAVYEPCLYRYGCGVLCNQCGYMHSLLQRITTSTRVSNHEKRQKHKLNKCAFLKNCFVYFRNSLKNLSFFIITRKCILSYQTYKFIMLSFAYILPSMKFFNIDHESLFEVYLK